MRTEAVIFSYGWPISGSSGMDYYKWDMTTPNIIDIGPNKASCPSPDIYPKELLDYWHKRSKKLVRRCYVRPLDEKAKRYLTLEELLERWSAAMDEEDFDGISIDEFNKSGSQYPIERWCRTLKMIREKYPKKLILCWVGGPGYDCAPVLQAIRDYADFCMLEIYYGRFYAAQGPWPTCKFPMFYQIVKKVEQNAPEISSKILIGIGTMESYWEERWRKEDPNIIYKDYLEAQVKAIWDDPVLKKLPGFA